MQESDFTEPAGRFEKNRDGDVTFVLLLPLPHHRSWDPTLSWPNTSNSYYSQTPFTTIEMGIIVAQYNKRASNCSKPPHAAIAGACNAWVRDRLFPSDPDGLSVAVVRNEVEIGAGIRLY